MLGTAARSVLFLAMLIEDQGSGQSGAKNAAEVGESQSDAGKSTGGYLRNPAFYIIAGRLSRSIGKARLLVIQAVGSTAVIVLFMLTRSGVPFAIWIIGLGVIFAGVLPTAVAVIGPELQGANMGIVLLIFIATSAQFLCRWSRESSQSRSEFLWDGDYRRVYAFNAFVLCDFR